MKHYFGCKWECVLLVVLCVFFVSAGSALGAGFALIEQGVKGLGNAYAGGAASAEDATTIFYNPAGLTRLNGQQLVVGGHVIMPSVKFHNEGSTHVLQPFTGVPLQGGNGGDAGVTKFIPNLYYSIKLSDRFTAGLGVNAPFGLSTEYDRHWVGRYHAIDSDLMSVNINPSVAYKVNDHLSIGAGLNVQYVKAKLSNAIDFGTLDFLGKLGLPAHALHLTPQQDDGYAKLDGDSWGVGFDVGALYEFNKNTRAGIAYRSSIEQHLDGDIDFSSVPAGLKQVPVFKDTGAKADLTLPDSLSVSIFHQFNPQWAAMADFTWTNWGHFQDLQIEFDNPHQPKAATTEGWQDSYRYSLGVTYTPTKDWTIRTGTAYDTSAVPNKERRTPRIPDSYRIWLALGLGYKISDVVSFDVGYAHLFIDDPEIDKKPVGEDAIRGGLKGTFDAYINIISAQLNIAF